MRKIAEVILVFIMVINVSACGLNKDKSKSHIDQMVEMGEKITECFENKDKDGLIALFSLNVEKKYNLEEEIETAFEFFDSEIVEHDSPTVGPGGGSSTPEGWVERELSGNIRNIVTQSGTTYKITYGVCLIDKNDEDNVGVRVIRIINENIPESVCFIGKRN